MSIALFDLIQNLSLTSWGIVVGSALAAILSGVIFWQDTTKRSSKFFFLLGLVDAAWGLSYASFSGSIGTTGVGDAAVLLYIFSALTPFTLFLFLYAFSDESKVIPFKRFLVLFSPFLVISAILKMYPGFIVGYQPLLDGVPDRIAFGIGFPIYIIYALGFVSAAIYPLIQKYRENAGIFKAAIGELLTVVLVSSTTIFIVSVAMPMILHGRYEFFWVGHVVAIISIFAIAFILLKYNFWNLKVIATELFISVVVLIFIAELFMASSPEELSLEFIITVLIVFSSSFLVGSVKREIQSKEKITLLVRDLDLMSKRLKILDKKKSEFLSIASHHLRDPLTAIKGYASMLEEGSFGELSLAVREAVGKIFTSSGHLITMISDFMDISRIESGEMSYSFANVDVKKLVIDLADGMKQSADRAHLGFHISIEGKDDATFITVGDAGKLRQVFSNLIDNSIKYTPSGDIYVALSKSENGKKILFSLSDTGIGMTETTKEKIFHKFSRADGVSKVYTEGTGLGLYVAKEIIRKHEGRIWADSRGEGHGSSFYVELDAKK